MTELTDDNFHSTLRTDPNKVLVDFYAPWCGPCKAIAPFLEELTPLYPKLSIYKVNIDACPQVATEYQISSVPTFKFFTDGDPTFTQVGFSSPSSFEGLIRTQLMNHE